MQRIFSTENLVAIVPGLALSLTGATFAIASMKYNLGTVNRMGPGFLPLVLGLTLAGLGVVDMVRSVAAGERREDAGDRLNWHAIACFLGSLLVFALLIEAAGFVPAVFCATFLAMMANRPVRPLYALLFGIGFSIASYLVFLKGLGLPVMAFGW